MEMSSNVPISTAVPDLEELKLRQISDWFYLRLHGRDHFRRADLRLEEQESDLLLDAYQTPDLSRETRRRFRLAAVSSLEQAVNDGPGNTWSAEAVEDLCSLVPAFVYGEEEEDAIAVLLLKAAERWPWISESRIRLKRQALLTLGDLSWQMVRKPCPDQAYWEQLWEQEAGDERNGRKHDFVGEAAGAIFSGIERSGGIAAALEWLGRTRWRGGYNADLIRKLIPSRKQKLGADVLMKLICDHLLPAMEGDDTKEDVVIEAMTNSGLPVTPSLFECLFQIKSAEDRAINTVRRVGIRKRMGSLAPAGYESEESLVQFVSSLLRNDLPAFSGHSSNRILEIVANAIRSARRETVIPDHSEAVSALSIYLASSTPSLNRNESLPNKAADIYHKSVRLHKFYS